MSETLPLLGQHSGTWRHVQDAVSSAFAGKERNSTAGDDEAPVPPPPPPPSGGQLQSTQLTSEEPGGRNLCSEWRPKGKSHTIKSDLLLNGFLCLVLVMVSVYEVILKEKVVTRQAAGARPFNLSSLIIWNSILSITIGVVVAANTGEMGLLLNSKTFSLLLRCTPAGCAFSFAAYLQFVILMYLPSDVFKVLEQSRLIVTASLSYLFLGRRQGRISWIMLVIVTFASATYGVVRASAPMADSHHDLLLFAQDLMGGDGYNVTKPGAVGLDAALFPSEIMGCMGKACRHSKLPNRTALTGLLTGRKGMRSVKQLLAKEELAEEIGKYVRDLRLESPKEPHTVGVLLTCLYVFIMCGASVQSESVLKDEGSLPFYIQKVYLEVPVLCFALFNMKVISPWLESKGIGRTSPVEAFFVDPFGGWDSHLVMLTFFFFSTKSWFSGLCVKVLSTLTKQVCAVLAVGLTYFFMLLHRCKAPLYHSTDFFCPKGLLDVSWEVAMTDVMVFVTIATYVLLQMDYCEDASYEKDETC